MCVRVMACGGCERTGCGYGVVCWWCCDVCVVVEGIASRGWETGVVREVVVCIWCVVVEVVALHGLDAVVCVVCACRLLAMQSAGQPYWCSRSYGDRGRSAALAVADCAGVRDEHGACRGGQGGVGRLCDCMTWLCVRCGRWCGCVLGARSGCGYDAMVRLGVTVYDRAGCGEHGSLAPRRGVLGVGC